MTPKNSQESKIGGHFCKMCTYDPLAPSSATPGWSEGKPTYGLHSYQQVNTSTSI